MTKVKQIVGLLSAVALWQGCSSTSDSGDASVGDAATTNPDVAGDVSSVFLSRGMNYYKVTAVSGVTDDCKTGAVGLIDFVFPVTFTEATGILTVGRQVGSPLQPTLGSGVVGLTGTLNRANDVIDGTCSWHQTDASLFAVTGGDVFTLDVTENQSAFNGCGTDTPTTGMCTSTFKLTLAITTAPVDAGTN